MQNGLEILLKQKNNFIIVIIYWIGHTQFLTLYLFQSANNCFDVVCSY